LLRNLQAEHRFSYLFISHDLRVVRALANDLLVMRNGEVVESGPTERLFSEPGTDYTRTLIAAAMETAVQPHPS
jgi:microcin C transport system ATP-binding protein